MSLLLYREFAVSQCVPQLNGLISRSRNDLTVIGGEGDREDIVGMADETSSRSSSSKFPEA